MSDMIRHPSAQTICQSCGAPMETEYVRMGAVVECRQCLKATVPSVPKGGTYPMSEYETTFWDFCKVLEDSLNNQGVAPLMKEWFGYEVAETAAGVRLVNQVGEVLDSLWVHLRIQDDSDQRYSLYRRKMSLWHGLG